MKKVMVFFIVSIILISSFFIFYKRERTENFALELEYSKPSEVYFCTESDCTGILIKLVNESQNIECAIYSISSNEFLNKLKGKNAKVIVDKNYEKYLINTSINYRTRKDRTMHNKFCIFDDKKIITGSFNVNENNNDNNLILVYSKNLARNYLNEFDEIWNLNKDKKTANPSIILNNKKYSSYFCPEDDCSKRIINEIEKAKKSIVFMTFSFTHENIAKEIIDKKQEGLYVLGIIEKSQNSKYSMYELMKNSSIEVILDNNKGLMHHKVFVIDANTVITGSMNPSKNGDEKNDENILIIKDEYIVAYYLNEFERLMKK